MRFTLLAFAACGALSVPAVAGPPLTLTPLASFSTGFFAQGGSEIPTYDALSRRAFVVNAGAGTVDAIDLRDPAEPALVRAIDLAGECGLPAGSAPNSVAAKFGLVAVAIQAPDKTQPGHVALLSALGPIRCVGTVPTGALPDMVTISPDGRYVVTADEGEPNSYNQPGSVDPEGSVTIIDLWRLGRPDFVRQARFDAFNARRAELVASGVRIFGPNASVAQDLEPEYVTIKGRKAWVTLQENNAIAVVDLPSATVERILPLGTKDHSLAGNGLDASDRDGAINIASWPVRGMYQPDGVASVTSKGRTYLITANEGDARDYTGFAEELRVGNSAYVLDSTRFPNASTLKASGNLGRLNVSRATGDTDGDSDFDRIDVFGARSISVWDEDGKLVWDSGDVLEQEVARRFPANFNAGHDDPTFDTRSDNKGPEPEGIAVGEVGGRTYAFVGLERISAIAVFDVTDPTKPAYVTMAINRDFSQPTNIAGAPNPAAGDLGPEGLEFVPAWLSPNRKPLLIVGNEISGTTTIWQID
jgi:hypothetical protein